MTVQKVFARSEIKYLVTSKQRERIENAMSGCMRPDEFGRSVVRSVYYDTPDNLLIRRSLSSPVYKEKLRLRSYSQASENSAVYAEVKKKYDSVVYKRRVKMSCGDAERYLGGGWRDCADGLPTDERKKFLGTQVAKEIDFMLERYGELQPAAFVSCAREAFYALDDHEFRVTFDDDIRGRDTELSLTSGVGGISLLESGQSLMEIKAGEAIPLWMCDVLSREKLFRTSFSKYGRVYTRLIEPRKKIIIGGKENASEFVCGIV